MSTPFVLSFRARWADMDFNQHMRNAAYLGCAEDVRMAFLEASGWTMREFMARKLGPVLLEDHLIYKAELGLLEHFTVDLRLAGITADGRRMRLRNTFSRERDGAVAAMVESVIMWLDLSTRRTTTPPEALRDIWLEVPRTDDFVALD